MKFPAHIVEQVGINIYALIKCQYTCVYSRKN